MTTSLVASLVTWCFLVLVVILFILGFVEMNRLELGRNASSKKVILLLVGAFAATCDMFLASTFPLWLHSTREFAFAMRMIGFLLLLLIGFSLFTAGYASSYLQSHTIPALREIEVEYGLNPQTQTIPSGVKHPAIFMLLGGLCYASAWVLLFAFPG